MRGGDAPTPSFVDNGDGTVTDDRTGLTWQQGEGGFITWGEAFSYCEGLSLGGSMDWCLPNVKELESLSDDARWSPTIDTNLFPGAVAWEYWSSTSYAASPSYAWAVKFDDGLVAFGSKFYAFRVRCVSAGETGSLPVIGYAPTGLSWIVNEGGTGTAQQLGIVNSGGGIMSWSADGDESWILVTPGSGTLARGEVAYNDVIVDTTGKAAGTYIGNVVISGYDAANTPQYVPITMTILPAITIISPNGGEVLSSGSSFPVTWNVNAPGQAVSNTVLTYTADGGATWKPPWPLRTYFTIDNLPVGAANSLLALVLPAMALGE